VSGNVSCLCDPNFIGDTCDTYLSSLSNETQVNSSISIQNNNVAIVYSALSISGSLDVNNSALTFTSSEVIIKQNLTFTNANITLTNTTITVDGCINLNNTNLTVNLTRDDSSKSKIVLLQSLKGCLNGKPQSISYLNKPKCKTVQSSSDQFSLAIVFSVYECSNSPPVIATWGLVLMVALFLQ